ncbi:hypothetical protein EYZ11_009922 [Aspergillus tanneri]|uniref:Carrier domain-containing protein n=1 Tax=Aspergillus tanneri TaxID=1220188 RepID=A0A4V3UNC1_9EURO|nr:hypothetical protein EYZ11_009922 [Aspergillus tanneri]
MTTLATSTVQTQMYVSEGDARRYELTLEGDAITDEQRAAFWNAEIEQIPLPLPPLLYSNRNVSSAVGWHRVVRRLDSSFGLKLDNMASKHRFSTTAFYLAALGTMASRLLNIDAELCVGVHAKGVMPVRLHPKPGQSVLSLLGDVQRRLERVLRHGRIESTDVREPLFTIALDCDSGPEGDLSQDTVNVEAIPGVEIGGAVARCVDDGSIAITLAVANSLYTQHDARLLLNCLIHILQNMQNNVVQSLRECPIFDPNEAWNQLDVGKGPCVEHVWPSTLIHKIDQIVHSQPDAIAVEDDTGLAVFCEPGIDSLCALLAITRVAGVYVPLDLNHPIERLALIVDDSRPHVIIAHAQTTDKVHGLHSTATVLDLSSSQSSASPVPISCSSDDAAFVLYTSGSTGRPKGVLLSHQNFAGQIASVSREFHLHRERVLQQSSLGFDVSLFQIFVALTTGGTLIIATNAIRREPTHLAELMRTTNVTFTLGVPSEYAILLRYGIHHLQQCLSWRYAVCGGERMTVSLKRAFRALDAESGPTLLSCYGPTEVSLASSYGVLSYTDISSGAEDENSPVGFTLPNYSVYILDEDMHPVPTGFPGEVYISGVGVAIGYLNNATRTNERFLPDPFSATPTTMYKTGDRGRLLPDRSLVFLGRIDGDFQIKLRGIRIELDEVANVIVSASAGILRQAAVVVRGEENKYLLGFVTFSQRVGDTDAYLAGLLARIPLAPSMRPAALVAMNELPMNVNGKLDRKALDAVGVKSRRGIDTVDMKASVEDRLKTVWEDVLETDQFEIHPESDFFQVGGNSLLLVKLQGAIHREFGVRITIRELFQVSILREMQARITSTGDENNSSINWDKEIQTHLLDLQTAIPAPTWARKVLKSGSHVLLTGATGFLGRYILDLLVNDATVETIHCLAVRPHNLVYKNTLSGVLSSKIQIWPGDLSRPYLGLMSSTFARLAETVDAIIHNGADVSFLKTYGSLRAPNVKSAVELGRMALTAGIPLHYVSSAGVMRLEQPDTDTDIFPPLDGSDGYIAGKWASERILSRAEDLGLRGFVHRPTTMVGDGVPDTDLLDTVMRYSRKMKAVPRFTCDGMIDMVCVREVARGIVQSLYIPSTKYTLYPGVQIPLHTLGAYLDEDHPLPSLDIDEWVEQARALDLNEQVASILLSEDGRKGYGISIPTPPNS